MRASPLLACACAILISSATASGAAPSGSLDGTRPILGGWAVDPDFDGPIPVHIYIDGHIAHGMLADALRTDLPFTNQHHAFSWIAPLQGPGNHQVIAYAIGVDAQGVPDGENVALTNSPRPIVETCSVFTGSAVPWCGGVASYYPNRATDTRYLFNDNIRVGVNTSFGGTIFELYGRDHLQNLLVEHGGAAMQLSVWGYHDVGGGAWFADYVNPSICDDTRYPDQASCLAAHASCRPWGASQGDHVANCSTVNNCAFSAAAPFNPIQAQAVNCGWEGTSNDVANVTVTPDGTSVFVRQVDPVHFTKSTHFPGMTFEQTTTLMPAYVKVAYRITYSGPYTLTAHPQEIPALFPAPGIHHTYTFYSGSAPWQGGPVTQVVAPATGQFLRVPNRAPYPHDPTNDGSVDENWVTACSQDQARCLTVAFFDLPYREINLAAFPGNGEGYLTPLGGFAIHPGMDEQFTTYVFPYAHDQVVAGKTVRQWIGELAAASNCLARAYPCDDGVASTVGDACDGRGSCVGIPVAASSSAAASSSSNATSSEAPSSALASSSSAVSSAASAASSVSAATSSAASGTSARVSSSLAGPGSTSGRSGSLTQSSSSVNQSSTGGGVSEASSGGTAETPNGGCTCRSTPEVLPWALLLWAVAWRRTRHQGRT